MDRSLSGQASTEYVAVIALVAVILTTAATAVAAPGIPRSIVRNLKLGLCIVGGDICRESDAVARGLEPCVVSANGGSSHKGVTVAFVRVGHGGSDMIERRSDGTLRISRADDWDVAGMLALGGAAGPHFDISASGRIGIGWAPGEVWEVPATTFRSLVRQAGPGASRDEIFDLLPEPEETFHELGVTDALDLTVTLKEEAEAEGVDIEMGASGRRELGLRTDRDGTKTFYYVLHDLEGSGLLDGVLPPADETLVEWRATEPPRLTMRIVRPVGDEETEEIISAVTLSDPEVRAAARRTVIAGGVVGGLALRPLADAIRAYGTIERRRYAVQREHGDEDRGVVLGAVPLGYDTDRDWLSKRLVDAEIISGPSPAKRLDCLRDRS